MHGGQGHGAAATAGARHKGRLAAALALTAGFMLVEVVAGLWTGSLALLADAAHMLTDAGGLALALLAIRFAERPATARSTYGFVRAEVLAALTNAVVLLFVTLFILYEAYGRFFDPPDVIAGPMFVVAIAGLAVNLASMKLLAAGSSESLNVKGAYFEVFADMLGSVGVLLAAAIVLTTGWELADPIVGAAIGLFIVPRTFVLLRQAVHILMEGAPPDIDVVRLERALQALDGVTAVHDLHVWTVTSGINAMSGHLVVADMADARRVLDEATDIVRREFGIGHTTIQIEDAAIRAEEGESRI